MSNTDVIVTTDYEILEEASYREKYEQIEHDLDEIKDNLVDAAAKMKDHLDEIIEFTKSSPHPKTYEALAKIVSSVATINKEAALVIQQKQQYYDSKKNNNEQKQVEYHDNRQLFVGTSTDLLDQILEKKKNND